MDGESPSEPTSAPSQGQPEPQLAGPRYRGVWMRRWGCWVAEVRMPNSRRRIWLGSYHTIEEAARAYDAATFCLRGATAKFNFPHDPPSIPNADSLTPAEIKDAARRFACSKREVSSLLPMADGGMTAEQAKEATTPPPVPASVPEPGEESLRLQALEGLLEEFPPEMYWMHDEVGGEDVDEGSSGSMSPLWNFDS